MLSCVALCCLVMSCLVMFRVVLSCLMFRVVLCHVMLCCVVLSCLLIVLACDCLVLSCLALSCLVNFLALFCLALPLTSGQYCIFFCLLGCTGGLFRFIPYPCPHRKRQQQDRPKGALFSRLSLPRPKQEETDHISREDTDKTETKIKARPRKCCVPSFPQTILSFDLRVSFCILRCIRSFLNTNHHPLYTYVDKDIVLYPSLYTIFSQHKKSSSVVLLLRKVRSFVAQIIIFCIIT